MLSGIQRLAGIAAAMLPARHWPSLDRYVPASSSAFAASLLTFLAGAAIGIPGFLAFATEQASGNTGAMLTAAARPDVNPDQVTTAMPVAATSLSLFTFLLLTPGGWATLYLGTTGLVRTVGAAFDDPRGDALVALFDAVVSGSRQSMRERGARAARASLEGPELPDRLVSGGTVGLPGHDFVIVASRRKPGWDSGTTVVTPDAAYRIAAIEERTIAGRLRTLYVLTEHRDLEVFRRTVHYELPKR
jgi:hypothetical protein